MCLGLISSTKEQRGEFGTLVVVPGQLVNQWESELVKFCGDSLSVLKIARQNDFTNVSVEDLRQADVVIVAASVLRHDSYLDRLGYFSGHLQELRASKHRHVSDSVALRVYQVGTLRIPKPNKCYLPRALPAFAKIRD